MQKGAEYSENAAYMFQNSDLLYLHFSVHLKKFPIILNNNVYINKKKILNFKLFRIVWRL